MVWFCLVLGGLFVSLWIFLFVLVWGLPVCFIWIFCFGLEFSGFVSDPLFVLVLGFLALWCLFWCGFWGRGLSGFFGGLFAVWGGVFFWGGGGFGVFFWWLLLFGFVCLF